MAPLVVALVVGPRRGERPRRCVGIDDGGEGARNTAEIGGGELGAVGGVGDVAAGPELVGGVLRLGVERRAVGHEEGDVARVAGIVATREGGEAVPSEFSEIELVGGGKPEAFAAVARAP